MHAKPGSEADHSTITAPWSPGAHIRNPSATHEATKGGTHGRISEAQSKRDRSKNSDHGVVGRQIGTQPEQQHLNEGSFVSLVGRHSLNTTRLNTGHGLEVIQPSLPAGGLDRGRGADFLFWPYGFALPELFGARGC